MDDVHKLHGCNVFLARVTPAVARVMLACGLIAGIANAGAEPPAMPTRAATTGSLQLAADVVGNPGGNPSGNPTGNPSGNPELPRSNDVTPATDPDDPPRVPLWTKYAYFVPARFSDLPG